MLGSLIVCCGTPTKKSFFEKRLYEWDKLSRAQIIQYVCLIFTLVLALCMFIFKVNTSSLQEMGKWRIIVILLIVLYFYLLNESDTCYENLSGNVVNKAADDKYKSSKFLSSVIWAIVIGVIACALLLPESFIKRLSGVLDVMLKILIVIDYILSFLEVFGFIGKSSKGGFVLSNNEVNTPIYDGTRTTDSMV